MKSDYQTIYNKKTLHSWITNELNYEHQKKVYVVAQRMSVNGGTEARPDTLITARTRQQGEAPAATVNNDQRWGNAALMPHPQMKPPAPSIWK